MALSGQRDENPYVDQQRVQQDVEALYRAGQGKIGTVSYCRFHSRGRKLTDRMRLESVVSYSPGLMRICMPSPKLSHRGIRRVSLKCTSMYSHVDRSTLMPRVEGEFSGHMKSGLLYLVKAYENDGQGIARDVEYLEDAMSGMGTKDERLYVSYHLR